MAGDQAGACRRQRILWTLHVGGVQRSRWVDCRRWDCPKCARDRRRRVAVGVNLGTGGSDLYAGRLPRMWVQAARRSLEATPHSSVRLGLVDGSLYVACDVATSGRGWRLEHATTVEVAKVLAHWPYATPRRVDWTGGWHAPPEADVDAEVLTWHTFTSAEGMRAELAALGVDVRLSAVADVDAVVARVRAGLGTTSVRSLLG